MIAAANNGPNSLHGGEKGFDNDGRCIVAVDPRYFRPAEVDTLLGDASKAKARLGWEPKIEWAAGIADTLALGLLILGAWPGGRPAAPRTAANEDRSRGGSTAA